MSSYAPRLRTYANSLISPVIPQTQIPQVRTTKRGTTAINYAEDGFDDDDFEDSEGPRRPTGLRSIRREDPAVKQVDPASQPGKELTAPVDVQGIWRDWMGKPKRGVYVEPALVLRIMYPEMALTYCSIDAQKSSFRFNLFSRSR
jgi:chromatin structure-remodeling complex subunit SFH1